MLARLYIKNVALIDEADVNFGSGFNALSGETGSGKSVILESINFVLGSKADKSLIRYGEKEAFVKAEFVVEANSPAAKALEDLDIESDGTIVISRKFSVDGKGSIKINGSAVSATMLKSVTSRLVDVHGQSEHFFLLNEDNQLSVIDGLCGKEVEEVKRELKALISQKRDCKEKISALGGSEQERARTLDLLSYQIDEISKADVKTGEYDELKRRQSVINNTEKIMSAINEVKAILSDDGGCSDLLSLAERRFSTISDYGNEYSDLYSRIENLSVEAEDISSTLSDLADNVSFDEDEARYTEERLTVLNSLRKKYGGNEESIISYLEEAKTKYDDLINCSEKIEKLTKEIADCDKKIYTYCLKLTEIRKKYSKTFAEQVVSELKTLNIPNAAFSVEFAPYDETSATLTSSNGSDDIKFMFSANKGEPLKPLSKVISGGEMSRFMLAVKTVLKSINGISTYIFDEIDAGISGYTARAVADKFISISKSTQIIAVSHLPQVCAASDEQFLISKSEVDGKTLTKIKKLTNEEKIDEIIRLTGSVNSVAARQHAEELIKQFNK